MGPFKMFTFECSLRIENPVLELNIYYKIVVGTVHAYLLLRRNAHALIGEAVSDDAV